MISGIAPELITTRWFNTDRALTLADLRGRVVVIEAFQMLCPGCVSHSLPQAMRVAETFSPDDVAVIGLHTVFEHHAAQGTEAALAAFLHEYRIRFPVAIDAPSEGERLPRTMKLYGMEGTPTVVLIDREGRLRKQAFGREADMSLGAEIMALAGDHRDLGVRDRACATAGMDCDESGCPVPELHGGVSLRPGQT